MSPRGHDAAESQQIKPSEAMTNEMTRLIVESLYHLLSSVQVLQDLFLYMISSFVVGDYLDCEPRCFLNLVSHDRFSKHAQERYTNWRL